MFEKFKSIPDELLFTGEIPHEASAAALAKMEVAEKSTELTQFQRARLGKITASRFGDIRKLRNGAWGETALTYLYDLVGEHLTGQPAETFAGNRATDWGNFYEADALRAYQKRTRRKTQPGTTLKHPTLSLVGGTPDAFCGERGLVEAKCPMTFKNHLRTVITREVPDEYRAQSLGHIWLSGRDWCDFISYDPRIEKGPHGLVIVRVRRVEHETELEQLAETVTEFHELLHDTLRALKARPLIF